MNILTIAYETLKNREELLAYARDHENKFLELECIRTISNLEGFINELIEDSEKYE